MKSHWTKYGRNYYSRYDYENVPSDVANALFASLRSSFDSLVGTKIGNYEVRGDRIVQFTCVGLLRWL